MSKQTKDSRTNAPELTSDERTRLVALIRRLKRASVEDGIGERRPLGNGFEYLVTGDNRALHVQIFERHSPDASVSFHLSRSITMSDLRKLQTGGDYSAYGLKTARRMARRENVLAKVGQKVLSNSRFVSLVRG